MDWNCTRCTFVNKHVHKKCKMCLASRPRNQACNGTGNDKQKRKKSSRNMSKSKKMKAPTSLDMFLVRKRPKPSASVDITLQPTMPTTPTVAKRVEPVTTTVGPNAFTMMKSAAALRSKKEYFRMDLRDSCFVWQWLSREHKPSRSHPCAGVASWTSTVDVGRKHTLDRCTIILQTSMSALPPGHATAVTSLCGKRLTDVAREYINVPLLKSALQKNVRRCRAQAAVRCAVAILQTGSKGFMHFIRRIYIICVEDCIMHPDLPAVTWLMLAATKGFQPPVDVILKLLSLVYSIAACPVRDDAWRHVDIGSKCRTGWPDLKPHHHQNEVFGVLRSLRCRCLFGGMTCDQAMLQKLAWSWDERFTQDRDALNMNKSTNLVSTSTPKRDSSAPADSRNPQRSETEPCSDNGSNIDHSSANEACAALSNELKDNSHQHHQSSQADSSSAENSTGSESTPSINTSRLSSIQLHAKSVSSKVGWLSYLRDIFPVASEQALRRAVRIGLQATDIPLAAVDFHCTAVLDRLFGDASPAPASLTDSLTPALAREAMWSCASSVSFKRVLAEGRTLLPPDTHERVSDKLRQVWNNLQPWCERYARTLLRTHWKLTKVSVNATAVPPTQVEMMEESSEPGSVYRVSLRDKYIKFIRDGSKTVEGRVARGSMLQVRPGDCIEFFSRSLSVMARVTKIERFRGWRHMLRWVGVQSALPDLVDSEDAVAEYNSTTRNVSLVQKFGVLAMHITTTIP